MKANVIKNHYSANGGTNNVIVFQVSKGFSLLKCFRGATAEKRAYRYCNQINS